MNREDVLRLLEVYRNVDESYSATLGMKGDCGRILRVISMVLAVLIGLGGWVGTDEALMEVVPR